MCANGAAAGAEDARSMVQRSASKWKHLRCAWESRPDALRLALHSRFDKDDHEGLL